MAMRLPYTATIGDGEDALALTPENGYFVRQLGPGQHAYQLQEITGEYQHGSAVLGATLRRGSMTWLVRVEGDTLSDLNARIEVLVAAVSQIEYRVHLQFGTGGASWTWTCHPADVAPVLASGGTVGTFDDGLLRKAPKRAQMLQLTIPRQPTVGGL